MTERTIRNLAKELAGQFYDQVRTAESLDLRTQISQRGRILLDIEPKLFGKCFPTVDDYLTGRQHGQIEKNALTGTNKHINDGQIYQVAPGWAHWYDLARQMLVDMLNRPEVNDRLKEAIMAAIIEDREKQVAKEAEGGQFANIHQRKALLH